MFLYLIVVVGFVCLVRLIEIVGSDEGVCREILEWRGWTIMARVSYCAFLLHMTGICTIAAHHTELEHTTFYHTMLQFFSTVGVTYMVAVPCWMLVEAPMTLLIHLCFEKDRSKNEKDSQVEPNKSSSSTI